MSLYNILTGNHILMMPMGPNDGSGGGSGGKTPTDNPNTKTGRDKSDESAVTEAEKQAKFADQIVQAKIMTNEQALRQKQIMEEISKQMGDAFQAQKLRMEQQQIYASSLSKDLQDLSKAGFESGEAIGMLQEKYEGFIGSNSTLYEEMTTLYTDAKGDMKKFSDSVEGLKGELDTAKGGAEAFDKGMKKFSKSMGFASSASKTFTGSILQNSLKLANLSSVAAKQEFKEGLKNSFKEMANPLNIFGSLMDNLIASVIKFDNASKNLQASLGDQQDLLLANSGELMRMGMTAEDQGRVVSELVTGFKALGRDTDVSTRVLKSNITTLRALGVEASSSTKILTRMSIGLGRNAEEVMKVTMALAANADAFGMTKKQIVQEFASMSDSLVAYGDEMEKVFIGLAEQSKRTGIAINNLNSLAEKFDKFTDAASTAGQVNALFGTTLSSMALNSMDAEERLDYLQQQFRHLDPGNMSRYQKLALKDAMGFASVAEAVQLLGGELSDSEQKQMDAMQLQKDMSETLGELARATLPLAKQFEVMFTELTSNPGATEGIINLLKQLSYVAVGIGNNFEVAIPVIFGVTTALYALASGASAAAVGFSAFIAVILAVAGVIYLLSDAMHHERSPKFYLMFGVIAAGIIALGLAAIFVQPGLMTLAAVFLGVGLTMSAVFYGMNMVVESLTGLFTVLSEGGDSFPKAASGLHLMATGMVALGTASLIATSAITAAMAGIGVITSLFSFGGTGVEDLIKVGDGMSKMGSGVERFGIGLEKIKVAASELKSSLGETLIAATMQGDQMSIMVGKEAAVATLFKNDTLNIKVDMPTINIPTPEFTIKIDGKVIEAKIEKRFNKQ